MKAIPVAPGPGQQCEGLVDGEAAAQPLPGPTP